MNFFKVPCVIPHYNLPGPLFLVNITTHLLSYPFAEPVC